MKQFKFPFGKAVFLYLLWRQLDKMNSIYILDCESLLETFLVFSE